MKYKTIKTLKDKILGKTSSVRSYRVEWNVFVKNKESRNLYSQYIHRKPMSETFIDKDDAEEFFDALETCYEVLQYDKDAYNIELKEELNHQK